MWLALGVSAAGVVGVGAGADDGLVAVMVHGAGGGGWEWDFWRPVWEESGVRVVARALEPVEAGLAATRLSDYLGQVVGMVDAVRGEGRRVVLVGASLGGILALKAAEEVEVSALVLVNPVAPAGVGLVTEGKEIPEVVRWAGGSVEATEAALPDGDRETAAWAAVRWRDESGAVLSEARAGVPARRPKVPVLVVVSGGDADIAPATLRSVGEWAGADVLEYWEMSHLGPLMGYRRGEVARACAGWVLGRVGG